MMSRDLRRIWRMRSEDPLKLLRLDDPGGDRSSRWDLPLPLDEL